jgi:hypothetical protein
VRCAQGRGKAGFFIHKTEGRPPSGVQQTSPGPSGRRNQLVADQWPLRLPTRLDRRMILANTALRAGFQTRFIISA